MSHFLTSFSTNIVFFPILPPGQVQKRGGFALGKAENARSGAKRGWFCTWEGRKRQARCKNGVVLHLGGPKTPGQVQKRGGFALGKAENEENAYLCTHYELITTV